LVDVFLGFRAVRSSPGFMLAPAFAGYYSGNNLDHDKA
jgi:hypothetical protein